MSKFVFFFMLSFIFGLIILKDLKSHDNNKKPVTVSYVDLQQYIGKWYEIAKIPNRFQRNCATGTTAEYSLREDGRINVVNRCIKNDGKLIEAKGIARIVDTKSNAKLRVSFVRILGISLFWGDYWIIGLDDDYQYAIVGVPNYKYGWILSRTPHIPQQKLEELYTQLREQGYDPDKFVMTIQSTGK